MNDNPPRDAADRRRQRVGRRDRAGGARTLAEHGASHVRRAYCTAEIGAEAPGRCSSGCRSGRWSTSRRARTRTDIALAVDAIDLVLAERPDVVVIASSDSDFAPLVLRLREKGCRVVGIGQEGKTGDETRRSTTSSRCCAPAARAPAAREPAAPSARRARRVPAAPRRRRRARRRCRTTFWPFSRHCPSCAPASASSSTRPRKPCGRRSCWVAAPARSSCSGNTRDLFALSPVGRPSKVAVHRAARR